MTTLASCAATVPNASAAPTTGPNSIATTAARLGVTRAAAARRWLIIVSMLDPRSAGQRLVDDRQRLVTLHHCDGGKPKHGAKFVGGDNHRTRRRRAAGSRLREGRRQCGMEGHVAFDLLDQLMDVPVQNGDRTKPLEQS